MPVITRALLRKRAEHNEGMISTLEEISLHQEELESINEVMGATCRKLKILYLQNNIIPKIENLVHLKDLEYVNLALNNITKIEGFQNCEFLNKLDLTVNFVDVDELEESITNLTSRQCLRDLYMMGNPCQSNWEGFTSYVIARLPQLKYLDGTEITRSMRILALQQLPKLEAELSELAVLKRREKETNRLQKEQQQQQQQQQQKTNKESIPETDSDIIELGDSDSVKKEAEELTDHSPETRVEMYRELAQQKKEKEDREKVNMPKERNYEKEHKESTESIRSKESELDEKDIKQRNEGQWTFRWDEESNTGQVILEVDVSKHLDSSIIDVDVHPTYISIVIKGKLLRLKLPSEVKVAESKCQRSKVSGSLRVIMPKINLNEKFSGVFITGKSQRNSNGNSQNKIPGRDNNNTKSSNSVSRTTVLRTEKKLSLQEEMMLAAASSASSLPKKNESLEPNCNNNSNSSNTPSSSVNIHTIVNQKQNISSSNTIDNDNDENTISASKKSLIQVVSDTISPEVVSNEDLVYNSIENISRSTIYANISSID
eukprot:gene9334-19376_t